MFCTKCGKENPNGTSFCESCGEKLPDAGQQPNTPLGERAAYEKELREEEDNIKLWNKGILAGLAVIIIWLGAYYGLRTRIISGWFLIIALLFPVSAYFRFDSQKKVNELRQKLRNLR